MCIRDSHRVELGLGLDRRPHMMVECQRHTLAGAMFGQRRQPAAIGGDVVIIQLRTAGKRTLLPVLDRLVCLAINNDRGTDSLKQGQLVGDALQLSIEVVVDQRAAVPARHQRQVMLGKHR